MAKGQENYYATTGRRVAQPPLAGRSRADICVIGAGFTGLSAALHLAEAGVRVILLEARQVGAGASGRNGGQIHSGQRKDQGELEQWLGQNRARDLWQLSLDAIDLLQRLILKHSIACDLKSGLIIAAHDRRALRALDKETSRLSVSYGYNAAHHLDTDGIARAIGTSIYPGGRLDTGGGHLNPLRFAQGLAAAALHAGAEIYEQTEVRYLDRQQDYILVQADAGSVRVDRVAVALDAYTADLLPELAPFIGHVESFIVATAPMNPTVAEIVLPSGPAVADTRHVLDYYRKSADQRLLFAGRESYWKVPTDIAQLVRPRLTHVFPRLANIPIEFGWSGTVGITRTRMPHFGWLGERLAFAHGYSGHGVAMAILGGRLLAEALLGVPERFDILRSVPAKPFPGGSVLRRPLVSAGLYWYKLMDRI